MKRENAQERGIERETQNPKQVPGSKLTAESQRGAGTHESRDPRDHDLSRPGAPGYFFFFFNADLDSVAIINRILRFQGFCSLVSMVYTTSLSVSSTCAYDDVTLMIRLYDKDEGIVLM